MICRWSDGVLPRARRRTVKRFQQRTAGKRHHPPRIKNSPSRSYAEIVTDRLCTRLRTWCTITNDTCITNDPPACPAWGWVKMVRTPLDPKRVQCFTPADVASSLRNSASQCIISRINCSTIRPRHTLQRSEARSRGSVASTVGRVQRFQDSIAQARFQPCEPSYPYGGSRRGDPGFRVRLTTGETKKAAQRFSAIGR